MRSVLLAIGFFLIVYSWALVARQTPVEQSTSATKPTPLILAANEGEQWVKCSFPIFSMPIHVSRGMNTIAPACASCTLSPSVTRPAPL